MSLYDAVHIGDIELVKRLIGEGCDPNTTSIRGKVPLMSAVHKNKVEIVKVLIEAKADVNNEGHCGNTPLYLSILWSQIECVRLLLQANANPSKGLSYHGGTPLHLSIYKPIVYMHLLIDTVCDYSVVDQKNQTVLTLAIENNCRNHTALLLDKGAKLQQYETLPKWALRLISKRKNIKHTIICFIALAKKTKAIHKDLIGEVVSIIWSTRDDEAWENDLPKRKKLYE